MHAGTTIVLGLFLSFAASPASAGAASTFDARGPSSDCRTLRFQAGEERPTGWSLSGGQGRWLDRRIVEVTGNGSDSNYWRSEASVFQPGQLYRFAMHARRISGSGSAICGPTFANRDRSDLSGDWNWYTHVVRAPDRTSESYLRLGQWHARGTVQFDAVRLCPVLPVHRTSGGLVLGDGESIRDNRYRFAGTFGHEGSNYHRTLAAATAGFNSDRWVFSGQDRVVYQFAIPDHSFLTATISFTVNYHTRGACVCEVSSDQVHWRLVATQTKVGTQTVELPKSMFPADTISVRLHGESNDSSFQVNKIQFDAPLSGSVPDMTGATSFATIETTSPDLEFRSVLIRQSHRGGPLGLYVLAHNHSDQSVKAFLDAVLSAPDQSRRVLPKAQRSLQAGQDAALEVPVTLLQPGEHQVVLTLGSGNQPAARSVLLLAVPEYDRTDYGELLIGAADRPQVWWCPAAHKVPRQRPSPTVVGHQARMSAAKNDWQAVQVIVQPRETLKGLTATARVQTPNATIGDGDIRVLRAFYHFVEHPTDRTGVRDYWPDALPPLSEPIDVAAGRNQPIWVLVHVPADAAAGDYEMALNLTADGWQAQVPIRLHVWDFALPERNHIETAFGFSLGNVARYHQLKAETDKRRVLDLYFQSFAEHRISPYDPTPLDPIRVSFVPDANPPRADLDFSGFDRAMQQAVDRFHFTGVRLHVAGMGGGTFHKRYEPQIKGFGETTPEYQTMFASYVEQLETHLRQNDWLPMIYVYWFDEPAPRDYEFVTRGMERLRQYAPGLRRMLTEEPSDALAAPVDIWCPVTPRYDHAMAEKRRQHGERFWWYVCTGPKAPYCTLFIDHPATELRVWLWQTWQRKINGILVWQSNYWTSSAAYPDTPQNPYLDPMGWRSGYSTPQGERRPWGNGDGRFLYPPLKAATPGASGPDPVFESPVSSIRWEMLREGIEDYEFLYLLRERLTERRDRLSPEAIRHYEALLVVPESITKDMTTFTTDPTPVDKRRASIAEAIEQLGQE